MQTQQEIVDRIVKILSKEKNIDKVFFFGSYLVNGKPYEISLIIYENKSDDYLISQFYYETLLKDIRNEMIVNLLPVNTIEAKRSLDKRLEDALCIYQRKETN